MKKLVKSEMPKSISAFKKSCKCKKDTCPYGGKGSGSFSYTAQQGTNSTNTKYK